MRYVDSGKRFQLEVFYSGYTAPTMMDYQDVVDGGLPTEDLLQLCKRLERAWTLADILDAAAPVVERVLGYPHVWLALFYAKPGFAQVLSHRTHGERGDFSQCVESLDIPIAGDAMMEEIARADDVVVVADARTDPRTNKAIVELLHNRTIINVPLLLAEQRLGALGMGTYGDVEGTRPPLPWQIDFMRAVATHVAVALDRVRFIQERKQAEDALYQEKERLQVTLHSISDAVITTNASGDLLYLNPMAEQLTGWGLEAAAGRPYGQVFALRERVFAAVPLDVVHEALLEGQTHRYPQLELSQRHGPGLLVETAVSPIRDADGEVQGAVLVFRDVTEQRRLSREIEFQATHDELTGLGNRRAFEHAMQQCLDVAGARQQQHVVCYLDLDDFKVVNDTCGHSAGDELLRQVARLFSEVLREQDHLCRIGGDEFGIVLTQQTVGSALLVAERLQTSLGGYRFVWRGQSFSVGVSIGMVVMDSHSESVGALLQAADSACYVAKEGGRARIHVWSDDDPQLAHRYGVMEWVSRLEQALQEDRFVLFAQPIAALVPSATDVGLHCEILVRLRDANGALVLPGVFMPAAERYRMAVRIDRWVVLHALRWLGEHAPAVACCAINLSGQSLGDAAFMSFVIDALAASGVPCEKLCFEITETAAISNMHTAQQFIATLRQLGCKLALDDFGSGLSSFAYLRNLPVDVLKIDGQFVKDMDRDPVSHAMVRSIHEIGCLMGKRTVAEFVENEAILAQLRTLGVHYAQGYAISRPVPLESLPGLA